MKGFTLIELLIVFALIGAILVTLLITISPMEQIKKGTDVTRSTITHNLFDAVIQSYIVRSVYPWTSDNVSTSLDSTQGSTIIQTLVQYDELKLNFAKLTAKDLPFIYLIASKEDGTLSFCFIASSKSYKSTAYYCNDDSCYVCVGNNTQRTTDTLPSFTIPSAYSYPRL